MWEIPWYTREERCITILYRAMPCHTKPLVATEANSVNSTYERRTMGSWDAAFLYSVLLYVLWLTNTIYDNGLHVIDCVAY